jgi:hypothetical protein
MSSAEFQKSAAGPAPSRVRRSLPLPSRVLGRLLASVFLIGVLAFLVWGAHYQKPRSDPWAPANFWQWWLSPQPDPLYKSMPVIPAGAASSFVPSELCLGARPCPAGLAIDGQRSIRLLGVGSSQPGLFLRKLVRLPDAHRLIGVSLAGLLYEQMSDSAWRPILPPDYGSAALWSRRRRFSSLTG